MHVVTPTALFRMSFILQDSSVTTTTTYLTKIIESELYTANNYLKERCERMLEAEKDRLMKKMSDRTELNKTA